MFTQFIRTTGLALVMGGALSMAPMAGWATTITPGMTNISVNDDYNFLSEYAVGSGAKTLTFKLTALTALRLDGEATTLELSGKFKKLVVKFDGIALVADPITNSKSKVIGYSYTINPTVFMAGMEKSLVISWRNVVRGSASRRGAADLSLNMETSPVPLPAGGLMLLGALGGIAALRRRKGAAAV